MSGGGFEICRRLQQAEAVADLVHGDGEQVEVIR